MGDVLKKFGRYFLLDQVAQGGMAEIYRARLSTLGEAGRLLVIKKIQAGYGANPEFVQMFKSEIKVTMGFNHPNIVQLYDFGEEKQQPFIAMEYVDGKNLRQFISRFAEMRQFFPIELAAYIVEQAACGLHYAHSFKDKITGQPQDVVHRDISPQNILISFEGTVKVIDFGIAKAKSNSESTRAGVIKGKPSYLSPEQISGETLDGRSDIFSLGAVLWELLVGKKLFAGENDLAVLKLIESCSSHVKPPSTINPKIPKELDYIVLKALAKHREKRYQTAEELQRALHKFLYGFAPDFNPSDLAYYAKDLFKDQIVEDRKRIQRLNDEVEKLLALAQKPVEPAISEGLQIEKDGDGTHASVPMPSGAREVFDQNDTKAAPKLEIEPKRPEPPRMRERRPPPSSASGNRPARPVAPQSSSRQKPSSSGSGPYAGAPAQQKGLKRSQRGHLGTVLGSLAIAGVAAAVYAPQVFRPLRGIAQDCASYGWPWCDGVHANGGGSESAPREPAAAAPRTASLRLAFRPPGDNIRVAVNGKPLPADRPVLPIKLDTNISVNVQREGYREMQTEIAVRETDLDSNREAVYEIDFKPLHVGYLTISTPVSVDVELYLDGKDHKPWVTKTPIREQAVRAGTFQVHLIHPVLNVNKWIEVTVDEGKHPTYEPTLDVQPGVSKPR